MSANWFFDQGVHVFPLQTRSKEPACKWMDYRGSRESVAKFTNYGVPLGLVRADGIGVVDTDTPETERWVLAHVPSTPFMVQTGKGWHRYFRLTGPIDKFLHRDGLTIEFRNSGQYVVGPDSVHPTGAVYTARPWSWNWEDIPFFPVSFVLNDGSCGSRHTRGEQRVDYFEFPEVVSAGERHDQLFMLLRSHKAMYESQGVSIDEAKQATRQLLSLANANRCSPPVAEDSTFERWFTRAWDNPDRPMKRPLGAAVAVNTFGDDGL